MTREEFDSGILKVTESFSHDFPSETAIAAWYQILKHISDVSFLIVVNTYIRNTKRLMRGTNLGFELSETYEALKKEKQAEKFRNQANTARANTGCHHCTRGMPGFVQCEMREGNLTYLQTYRCTCNHDARFAHVPFYTTNQQEAV